MIRLAALLCGLICGTGMILSGLFQPTLLWGLGSSEGAGGLTLGLGLLSAFCAAALVIALTRTLSRPFLGGPGEPMGDTPTPKALAGGVLFGFGWGLCGYFPLSAIVAIGLFAPGAAIFLASVVAGMILHDLGANGCRLRFVGLRSGG